MCLMQAVATESIMSSRSSGTVLLTGETMMERPRVRERCGLKRYWDIKRTVRTLLAGATFVCAQLVSSAVAQQSSDRLSVADLNPRGTQEQQLVRFQLYQRAGIGMLRIDEGDWRSLETAPDNWNISPQLAAFVKLAERLRFQLKSSIGALHAPPVWFFKMHPDAQMIGRSGTPNELPLASTNVISYWYPQLHELLESKDDQIFAYLRDRGLLRNVRFLVVPGGPAGEPIYPSPWTTADPNGPARFWFYDENAQADFVMTAKSRYGSIASANLAWGTSFENWRSVKIPLPGAVTGQMWSDVLTWYRDTKRAFFKWQISRYDHLRQKFWEPERRPKLLVLVPGEHFTPSTWNEAVRGGGGNACIRAMCDSAFLLDTAASFGAAAQYTGLPAMAEVEYLENYIRAHEYSLDLWGENVGNVGVPAELGNEVLSNGLYGLEYVGSNLFAADQTTPLPKLFELAAEYSRLLSVWAGEVRFNVSFTNTTLASGGCLRTDRDGRHQLCMEPTGQLAIYEESKAVWRSESRGGNRGHCIQSEGCRAVFQGDGNFVVYDGTDVLWASGTAGSGTNLVLTDKEPYVEIDDRSGKLLWSPKNLTPRH